MTAPLQTFTALPVGCGDAFLLKRPTVTILVDGGSSKSKLPDMVRRHLRPGDTIDIVVCSHADADHAMGLVGLMAAPGFEIVEVWLPGRWGHPLFEFCRDPQAATALLAHEVSETDDATLEECARPDDTQAPLIAATDLGRSLVQVDIQAHAQRAMVRVAKVGLFNEAIEAAKNIVAVATTAQKRGARLRWFDVDTPMSAHSDHRLTPMNSGEVESLRAAGSLLQSLALSVSNRKSLVFLAPLAGGLHPVLFSADSPLDFLPSQSPWGAPVGLLATAPHHGSRANENAYGLVTRWGSAHWVRSDQKTVKHPCKEYINQGSRACTTCRNRGHPGGFKEKQAVVYEDTGTGWVLTTDKCDCEHSRP